MGNATLDDYARDVAVDYLDNVYISGFFSGNCDFDTRATGGVLTSSGGRDAFVASYNYNGDFRWAQRMGGLNDDEAWGVAVSPIGEVGVCGKYMLSANIGGTSYTSNGSEDMFVAALDSSGSFRWTHSLGGSDNDLASCIAADGCGNFYLTGSFQGTVDFDPGSGTRNLTAPVSTINPPFSITERYGYFAARYDQNGSLNWAGAGNATGGRSRGWGIALDHCEDLYLTGEFTSTQDFNITSGTANRTPAGGTDIFLTKHSLPHVTVVARTNFAHHQKTYSKAILCANSRPGRDTIRFCIPNSTNTFPISIEPYNGFPDVTDDTTIINVQTQPGYTPGAVRLYRRRSALGCGACPADYGIRFQGADHCEVHGLMVDDFDIHGIYFHTSNHGIVHDCIVGNNVQDGIRFFNSRKGWIYGCHIGVEANNQTAMPNGRDGIATNGTADSLWIGVGAVSTNIYRNYIYNNVRHGIYLNTDANTIYGTTIGNDGQGNGGNGILITGSDNRVSGSSSTLDYIIDNAGYGIEVSGVANTGNYLIGARFRCNALGGIEINTANNGVPSPVITVPDVTNVSGTGVPQASVRLFEHQTCGNAPCQGWTYLGGTTVDALGNWSIPGSFTSGSFVTAIHYFANTQITTYNTSEFSPCAMIDFLLDGANIELSGKTTQTGHYLGWKGEGLGDNSVFTIEKKEPEGWTVLEQTSGSSILFKNPDCNGHVCTYRISSRASNEKIIFSNTIELTSASSAILLFPNPAHDFIQTTCQGDYFWKIMDLQGKLIQTGQQREERRISIQELPPGLFLLEVNQNGRLVVLPFAKR
ncbi:MAG: right-handed parallel beta-helix repeat-containing protein [Bacteroidia bacterium]